ncbi:MAG: hypothetical protein LBQ47_08965, partial [Endomicrobium sp.]|nr:hypothetical protein [Endomicrobium sp.]
REQRKAYNVSKLIEKVESLPASAFKHYNAKQRSDILKKGRAYVSKSEEEVLKKVAGNTLNDLKIMLKNEASGIKKDDAYLLRELARNKYDVKKTFDIINSGAPEDFSRQFVNPNELFSDAREILALWLSEDYVLSSKIEKSMLEYFASNKTKDFSRQDWTKELLNRFQRDIIVEALLKHKDEKTISFGESLPPALLTLASALPYGWGQLVRAASTGVEIVKPGTISGFSNKLNQRGYEVFDPVKDDLLRALHLSENDLNVYDLSDEKKIMDWIDKKEKEYIIQLINEKAGRELGFSNISNNLANKIVKEYEYEINSDKSAEVNSLWDANKSDIYSEALEWFVVKVGIEAGYSDPIYTKSAEYKKEKAQEYFDAMNSAADKLAALYGQNDEIPKNAQTALKKAAALKDTIIRERIKALNKLIKKEKTGEKSVYYKQSELLRAALSNYSYDVNRTFAALKESQFAAVSVSVEATPEQDSAPAVSYAQINAQKEQKEEFLESLKDAVKAAAPDYEIPADVLEQIGKYFFAYRHGDFQTAKDMSILLIIKEVLALELDKDSADISIISELASISDIAANVHAGFAKSAQGILLEDDIKKSQQLVLELKQLVSENKTVEAGEKIAALRAIYKTAAQKAVEVHSIANKNILKSLNYSNDNNILRHIEAVIELLKIEKDLAVLKNELNEAENILAFQQQTAEDFENLYDRISSFNLAAAQPAAEADASTAHVDIKALSEEERSSAVNDIIAQLKDFLPASYSGPSTQLRLQILKDYAFNKDNPDFDRQTWIQEAVSKFTFSLLSDALVKEMSKSVKEADVFETERLIAIVEYLNSENGGQELSQVEKAALDNRNDFILRAASAERPEQARKNEIEIVNGALEKLGIESNAELSEAFKSAIVKEYFKEYFEQWNLGYEDKDDINNNLAQKYKTDVFLDLLIAEVFSQNPSVDKIASLLEKLGKSSNFYSASTLELIIERANAIAANKGSDFTDEEKIDLLNRTKVVVNNNDETARILYEIFKAAKKNLPDTFIKDAIEYLRPLGAVRISYNHRFGSVTLSGLTNFQTWSINLTLTADTKEIFKELKNQLFGKDEKNDSQNANQIMANDEDMLRSLNKAVTDALADYLPKGFELSEELKNRLMQALKKEVAQNNGSQNSSSQVSPSASSSRSSSGRSALISTDSQQDSAPAASETADNTDISLAALAAKVIYQHQVDILSQALSEQMSDPEANISNIEKIFKGLGQAYGSLSSADQAALGNLISETIETLKKAGISQYDLDRLEKAFSDNKLKIQTRALQGELAELRDLIIEKGLANFYNEMFGFDLNEDSQRAYDMLSTLLYPQGYPKQTPAEAVALMSDIATLHGKIANLSEEEKANVLRALSISKLSSVA